MGAILTIEVEAAEVEDFFSEMGERASRLGPFLGFVGQEMVSIFKSNIVKETGGADYPGWAPLAESTVAERERLGYGGAHPMLQREHDLISHFTFSVAGNTVAAGTDGAVIYAAFHDLGEGQLQRAFVHVADPQVEGWVEVLAQFIVDGKDVAAGSGAIMTLALYEDLLQAPMLRGIRKSLAEDQELLAFFGDEGIRTISYEELEHTIVPPLLAVVSGQGKPEPVISDQANITYSVPIVLFLPRQTPVNPAIPRPAAPTITPASGGPLSGVYSYRATFWNEAGESWASEPTDVTLSHQSAGVSFGTPGPGVKGARLWRTAKGRSAYRYDETIQPDVLSAGWRDELPDAMLGDELAPVQLFAENLKDYLRGVLWAHQTIRTDEGVDLCDAALVLGDRIDRIDRGRNLRIVGMEARYSGAFSVATMKSTADVAP